MLKVVKMGKKLDVLRDQKLHLEDVVHDQQKLEGRGKYAPE